MSNLKTRIQQMKDSISLASFEKGIQNTVSEAKKILKKAALVGVVGFAIAPVAKAGVRQVSRNIDINQVKTCLQENKHVSGIEMQAYLDDCMAHFTATADTIQLLGGGSMVHYQLNDGASAVKTTFADGGQQLEYKQETSEFNYHDMCGTEHSFRGDLVCERGFYEQKSDVPGDLLDAYQMSDHQKLDVMKVFGARDDQGQAVQTFIVHDGYGIQAMTAEITDCNDGTTRRDETYSPLLALDGDYNLRSITSEKNDITLHRQVLDRQGNVLQDIQYDVQGNVNSITTSKDENSWTTSFKRDRNGNFSEVVWSSEGKEDVHIKIDRNTAKGVDVYALISYEQARASDAQSIYKIGAQVLMDNNLVPTKNSEFFNEYQQIRNSKSAQDNVVKMQTKSGGHVLG